MSHDKALYKSTDTLVTYLLTQTSGHW